MQRFGRFVPYDFPWQTGIEWFAVTALLARVRGDGRFRDVFLSGRRVRAESIGFVEQTELVGVSRLALWDSSRRYARNHSDESIHGHARRRQ